LFEAEYPEVGKSAWILRRELLKVIGVINEAIAIKLAKRNAGLVKFRVAEITLTMSINIYSVQMAH